MPDEQPDVVDLPQPMTNLILHFVEPLSLVLGPALYFFHPESEKFPSRLKKPALASIRVQ